MEGKIWKGKVEEKVEVKVKENTCRAELCVMTNDGLRKRRDPHTTHQ